MEPRDHTSGFQKFLCGFRVSWRELSKWIKLKLLVLLVFKFTMNENKTKKKKKKKEEKEKEKRNFKKWTSFTHGDVRPMSRGSPSSLAIIL